MLFVAPDVDAAGVGRQRRVDVRSSCMDSRLPQRSEARAMRQVCCRTSVTDSAERGGSVGVDRRYLYCRVLGPFVISAVFAKCQQGSSGETSRQSECCGGKDHKTCGYAAEGVTVNYWFSNPPLPPPGPHHHHYYFQILFIWSIFQEITPGSLQSPNDLPNNNSFGIAGVSCDSNPVTQQTVSQH